MDVSPLEKKLTRLGFAVCVLCMLAGVYLIKDYSALIDSAKLRHALSMHPL